jgi:hypothetical protein
MFHRFRDPFIPYIDAEHKHAPRRTRHAVRIDGAGLVHLRPPLRRMSRRQIVHAVDPRRAICFCEVANAIGMPFAARRG